MKTPRTILALVVIFSFAGLMAKPAMAKDDKPKEETFQAPKQGKLRLAYCYEPDKGCGEKAANAWCKDKGFKGGQKSFEVLHQEKGKVKATRYIGSDGTCKSRGCDTFASITCKSGPPTFF